MGKNRRGKGRGGQNPAAAGDGDGANCGPTGSAPVPEVAAGQAVQQQPGPAGIQQVPVRPPGVRAGAPPGWGLRPAFPRAGQQPPVPDQPQLAPVPDLGERPQAPSQGPRVGPPPGWGARQQSQSQSEQHRNKTDEQQAPAPSQPLVQEKGAQVGPPPGWASKQPQQGPSQQPAAAQSPREALLKGLCSAQPRMEEGATGWQQSQLPSGKKQHQAGPKHAEKQEQPPRSKNAGKGGKNQSQKGHGGAGKEEPWDGSRGSSSAAAEKPVAHGVSPGVTSQTKNAAGQQITAPKKQPTVPEKHSAASQKQQAVPQKQQPVPQKQPTTPQKQPTTPQKQPTTPQKQPTTPQKQQPVPQKQQPVPQKQPTVAEKQATTSGKQPPASEKRPTASEQQRAATGQQPSVAQQPAAAQVTEENVQQELTKVTERTGQLSISEPAGAVGSGDQGAPSGDKEPIPDWIITKKDKEILEKDFPEKPKKAGDKGMSVRLQVNHYPIQLSGNRTIFMYDVTIKPKADPNAKRKREPEQVKSKKFCRAIWKQYMAKYGKEMDGLIPAYDGFKIARVVEPGLPDSEKEVTYKEDDEDTPRTFIVTLKRAGKDEDSVVNLLDIWNHLRGSQSDPPLKPIAAVNAFFAHMPSMLHLTVGRRFLYADSDSWSNLGEGKLARFGFTMSVREGDKEGWTLHLCVNSVAGVFAKAGNAATIAAEVCGCDRPEDIMRRIKNFMIVRKILREHFDRLKVKTGHNGRKKVITGVSRLPMKDIKFMHGEGPKARMMSLVEYYRITYKVNLRFVDLPCFHVGEIKKNTFIPIEICEVIPNQSRLNQLSESQTRELLNAMNMSPEDRFGYIKQDVARFAKESSPLLKQIGMQLDANAQYIPGRVIPAPNIQYRANQVAKPDKGSWNTTSRHKFKDSPPGSIPWGYAWSSYSGVRDDSIRTFVTRLKEQAESTGLNLGKPVPIGPIVHPGDLVRNEDVQYLALVIVVLPDNRNNPGVFRDDLKRIAETKQFDLGLMTQCVRPQHFLPARGKPPNAFSNMYIGNLLLKINTKLGGVNSAPMIDPDVMEYIIHSQTLIVGADVTHAPPGSTHPSVAAIVGSVDLTGLRYVAHTRVQEKGTEYIIDMKNVMKQCLVNYKIANGGRKPKKILYFRDGVGEGDFKNVRSYEIAKIQEACKELEVDYYPKISLVIVQKRHQTRFKPTDRKEATRSGNVLPGTVVDTHITSPRLFDFYLVSHEGIKGTSRPTHYWLVWDDNHFTPNGIQALTYYFCHCYARCNRSVSIPAPTYYAHHVAFRAKGHIKEKLNPDYRTEASGSSEEGRLDLSDLNGTVVLHERIEPTMFFV